MITDASGKRIGGDGPTGRELHVIEIVKDGKKTWGLAPVGGEFDKLEVVAILNQTALAVVTTARSEMYEQVAKNLVQANLNKLQGEK